MGVWGEELQQVESRHGVTGKETALPVLQCGIVYQTMAVSACGLVYQNPSPTYVFYCTSADKLLEHLGVPKGTHLDSWGRGRVGI